MSDKPHPKNHKSQFSLIEEEVLAFWQKHQTFNRSLQQRKGGPVFSFYDGPPFANGLPHFGHSLVTTIKDAIGRYKTMQGYYVERVNGWDCHGLPVEYAVEKQFGVSGKKQILDLGLDKFNAACRESVFLYKHEWEDFFARIGRWTDTDRAYATIDSQYTESVWWVISEVHRRGLLYKGFKSMPYCPRCETPLSNFELNEGYKDDVADPSLYVKFRLIDDDEEDTEQGNAAERSGLDAVQGSDEARTDAYKAVRGGSTGVADTAMRQKPQRVSGLAAKQAEASQTFLLVWTTTPWSLPGNAALALNPDETYVYVTTKTETGESQTLILAKKRLEVLADDYQVVKEVAASQLVGRRYQPLFKLDDLNRYKNTDSLYMVWAADIVSIEEGSGVLHIAPSFGEDDLTFAQNHGLPVLNTVDRSGKILPVVGLKTIAGKFFKAADEPIIEYLTKKGAVYASGRLKHTYPFCYRCDSPLLYYAVATWFIKVSAIREQLLKTAKAINWVPAHIKEGRFGQWLEGAKDWAISRNRYWGAPLPIWVNQADETDYIVVKSITELEQLTGKKNIEDLHRPFIDKLSFVKDGKTYTRVEEVLDCWVESGSMPVAKSHYPFNLEQAGALRQPEGFPADYVGEGLDQTRLWFYVMHVISTILFDKPAYKNVLVSGIFLAADGEKLSKRLKNYPPLEEVFSNEGADSLRLYLLASHQALGADYDRFNRNRVKDINRNILQTLLNSFRFFKTYSEIDNWRPKGQLAEPKSRNLLDQWILARLNLAVDRVTKQADKYQLAKAVNEIFTLVDDLSNWYIRRSRRRFWRAHRSLGEGGKSEDDTDKRQAYQTLHYVLTTTCQLLAPWAPFLSEKIYRELVGGTDLPQSVHLSNWPAAGKIDAKLLAQMDQARIFINQGLAQRAAAGLKVRQPLAAVQVPKLPEEFGPIIAEELNVKTLNWVSGDQVRLDTQLTEELKLEGVARDLIRFIQSARKKAGLDVADRIKLGLLSDDTAVNQALGVFGQLIASETLATALGTAKIANAYQETVNVSGVQVTITLAKTTA